MTKGGEDDVGDDCHGCDVDGGLYIRNSINMLAQAQQQSDIDTKYTIKNGNMAMMMFW